MRRSFTKLITSTCVLALPAMLALSACDPVEIKVKIEVEQDTEDDFDDSSDDMYTESSSDNSSMDDTGMSEDTGTGDTETEDTGSSEPELGDIYDDVNANIITECNDGIDNDGDGLVDWQYDLGCVAKHDSTEGGVSAAKDRGWTAFEPASDTVIVYISTSVGDDSYDGLSPDPGPGGAGPVATLDRAKELVRPNSADWLLFRRGDTFEDLGILFRDQGGRSPAEPFVISSYGESEAQPIINGFFFPFRDDAPNYAIMHLSFGPGSLVVGRGDNGLVEGNAFQGGLHAIGISAGKIVNNLVLRRNTVRETDDSGFYLSHINGLLVEENVFYRPSINSPNHAMYLPLAGSSDYVVKDNLIYMGQDIGHAILMRTGGVAEGNIIADFGWSGISIGACDDGEGA